MDHGSGRMVALSERSSRSKRGFTYPTLPHRPCMALTTENAQSRTNASHLTPYIDNSARLLVLFGQSSEVS
ncbi:hypothetical protein JTE90_015207 [Oedothorax gibbosus]|uniref:Uncharacterized protein n=1 Tax=Oedothorax gibbosus TaxID=931172 RepID=A0AAV6VA18_9ARAC|nr:hypothetical protein JTE90_015207 [Oedothorax gibbosus]